MSRDQYRRFAKNAKPQEMDKPPLGTFQTILEEVGFYKGKTSGKELIRWQFKIIEGIHANRKVWKYHGLDSQEKHDWLATDLAKLDIDYRDFDELIQDQLPQLLNTLIQITVKQGKGDMPNVYIDGFVDERRPTSQEGQTRRQREREPGDDDNESPPPEDSEAPREDPPW